MPRQLLSTGIEVYYEVHGEGDPIVLVPGTGFAGNVWLPYQVPEFSKSHQVVIFDPRGCGRTTRYEGVYTIDQMGCDIVALLDHLGIPAAHLVGHSMGGRIALSAALNFPGRVKSLVMAASGSGAVLRPGDECISGVPYSFISHLIGTSFEDHIRHSILESDNYFSSDFRARHPEQVQALYELVREHHAGWNETVRQTIARHNWEATHRLGDLVVPTLIMIGDGDDIGMNHVEQAEQLRRRIAGAEFVEIKGTTHGFFWQAPEETNRVILDWVARKSQAVSGVASVAAGRAS